MSEILIEKNNLKGGEFLVKGTLPETIFTPNDISEEQQMIAQLAKDFIEKEILPKLDAIDKQESGLTVNLMNKAGELGLLGVTIPEEFGGIGSDFNTNTVLAMEMGTSHSFGVSFAAHTGIGTLPILYYGSNEQKVKYLPKLASGEIKSAYCLTEPTSGSDALAAKATATLSDDGKFYILNGQKMWITNGGFADILITFAQVDGNKFTSFIIPTDIAGFTRGEEENKLGIKGSSTRALFLDNVKVPIENVLGEIGKGHYIAFNVLNVGRFKLGAMTTGGAKKFITVAIKYANERKQFGKPISSFGAIKYKIAEMASKIYAAEAATLRTSGLINDLEEKLISGGTSYSDALITAAEEYAIESSIMKVFGSEMLDYVVDEVVQIHGGYGYSEEYPAARAYRDSRINRIFEGTNEINRLLIVDMLFKKSMKGKIDLLTPALGIQKELLSIPERKEESDEILSNEMKVIENAKKSILMIAGLAAQKFMSKLSAEQELIMHISDMIIDVFASESVVLRTKKLVGLVGDEKAKIEIAMAKLFVFNSIEQIAINGKHAVASFCTGDELRLLSLGLKRFTKQELINTTNLRREIANSVIETNEYKF